MPTLEFCLTETELLLNSVNSLNSVAWIGVILKILSISVTYWLSGKTLTCHKRSHPIKSCWMKLKIIVTEFSEFSENQFRKTLLNWLLANTLKTGCIFIWNYMMKSKHKRPLNTCLKIDVVTVGHSVHRGVSDLWSGGVSATPLHSDIPGRPPQEDIPGHPPGQTPPWADTPLTDTTSSVDTPSSADTPSWAEHVTTPAQCMLGYTHAPAQCMLGYKQPPSLPKRTVRIPLECILVIFAYSELLNFWVRNDNF